MALKGASCCYRQVAHARTDIPHTGTVKQKVSVASTRGGDVTGRVSKDTRELYFCIRDIRYRLSSCSKITCLMRFGWRVSPDAQEAATDCIESNPCAAIVAVEQSISKVANHLPGERPDAVSLGDIRCGGHYRQAACVHPAAGQLIDAAP